MRHRTFARALVVTAILPASIATRAQPPRVAEEPGVSGYVLAPDAAPVSGGTVLIESLGARTTTSIERTGRFRFVPNGSGLYRLVVNVSGLEPYRVSVSVPASRTLKLPVIHLSPATYFRVRFVAPAGEPLTSPQLRHSSLDANGSPIPTGVSDSAPDRIDSDGTITIGPLPRSVTVVALNTPPFALTRLPDLYVTGNETLLDGGTVTVQPGAVLNVDLVNENGDPVPQHDVVIEDLLPRSLLFPRSVRTDQHGRATFERLSGGRYRVRTTIPKLCGGQGLSIAPVVTVPGSGTVETRLVVGGRATFRIISPLGPLRGVQVSASPDAPPPAPSPGLRGEPPFLRMFRETSCGGMTDDEGRVTVTNFPPGPARVGVRLPYSMYVRRVAVPVNAREVDVVIPDGLLPVRVTSAIKNDPVARATVAWTGSGGRVEATTSAIGDALLEGVGTAGGTLSVMVPGYQPFEENLTEPPATLHEVALTRPPVTSVRARVITVSGEPVPYAVVQFKSGNPIDAPHIAVADARGLVTSSDAPSGSLEVTAIADGFVTVRTPVAEEGRAAIVVTLSRGYRAIVEVELPADAGPQIVRVVSETGASIDGLLDLASDRRVEPPASISLGPLPPGTYVIEFRGPHEPRQERIRIVDRDVHATIR